MSYSRFAQYYDSLYKAQGKDYEREACRLHRLIRRYKTSPGDSLLDVGCGTGEHLRYLRAFYKVTGVDVSDAMLAVARGKLPGVPLHKGDMRTFQLEALFDVVVCLFGSIGYAETWEGLRQAVENMRRHLVAGGVLVIEPWLEPGKVKDGYTQVVVAQDPERKVVRVGQTRVRGKVSTVLFHFVVADKEGIEHFEERHRLGLFGHEEYKEALIQSGLLAFYDPEGLTGRGVYIGYLPPD